jgi:hypothetical protein
MDGSTRMLLTASINALNDSGNHMYHMLTFNNSTQTFVHRVYLRVSFGFQ